MVALRLKIFDEIDHFSIIIFGDSELVPEFYPDFVAEEDLVLQAFELGEDLLLGKDLVLRHASYLRLHLSQIFEVLVTKLDLIVFDGSLLVLDALDLVH